MAFIELVKAYDRLMIDLKVGINDGKDYQMCL